MVTVIGYRSQNRTVLDERHHDRVHADLTFRMGDEVRLDDGATGVVVEVTPAGDPAWTVYRVRTELGFRACYSTDLNPGRRAA